jgi:peptidoglycan/LPS O-acetylase OafA/YrhL
MTTSVRRSGNFDALRLVAASAVVFGHSFIVTIGSHGTDFLAKQAESLAICAVETFFILSGYLVTQSFEHSRSWLRFVLARALRIFPGLVACILFSAFILGPALTKLSFADYFTDQMLYRYLTYNPLLEVLSFPFLPEVAFHSYGLGTDINGSLWSLPFEFAFYSIVFVFGLVRQLNGRTATVLLGLALFGLTFRILDGYAWFLSYFAAGMALYFLRKRGPFSGPLAGLAGLGVVIGNFGPLPWALFPVLGAYTVIYIAVDAPFQARNATRFGDLSYGIYLYGWPCEEMAMHILGGRPPWWQVFALALPSAALLAWVSWHAVERPMLRWKDADLSGLRQRIGAGAVLVYAATAIVFGIGETFPFLCLLPAALALAGAQVLGWGEPWLKRLTASSWHRVRPALPSTAEGLPEP